MRAVPTSGPHLDTIVPWLLSPALNGFLWVVGQPGGYEFLWKTIAGFYLTPVLGDVWLDTYRPSWQTVPSPIT